MQAIESGFRIGSCAILAALALSPITAHACPPPRIVSLPLFPQNTGETDDAYFDRLVEMTAGYGFVERPARLADETAEAFAARLAAFEEKMRSANVRVNTRREAAMLVALEREEAARWDTAPQVLLAIAGRTRTVQRGGVDWVETSFRITKRVRGNTPARTFALRYPAFTTSCGPYYPSFASGTRLVLFAKSGPVRVETMIGYYFGETARDSRTKELLGPVKP